MEPVATEDLLAAAFAGALIVIFGALYAIAIAMAGLKGRPPMLRWVAYLSYFALAVAVIVLARVLNLGGIWRWLVAAMMLGYWIAPRLIWRLCVGTHHDDNSVESASLISRGGR